MYRIESQNWARMALSLFGWLLLVVAVAAICYFVSFVITVSYKMALVGLAGIMGLVCLLLILPNPRLGVYLTFGIMPFSGWAYKQSPGSGFNLLVDGLVLVTFLATILHPKARRLPAWIGVPVLAMLVLGFIQAFNPASGANSTTIFYAFRAFLLPIFLFYVGFHTFHTRQQVERLLLFILLVSIVNGAWAMKQFFLGLDPAESAWAGADQDSLTAFFTSDGTLRAFSTFDSPWDYGYYTSLVLTAGVALFFALRSNLGRLATLAGLGFSGVGLVLTIVRTGWAMAAFGVVLVFILVLRHRLRGALIALGVGGALVVLLLMVSSSLPTGSNPAEFAQMMAELNILQDESLQNRFAQWSRASLPAVAVSPLGRGLGTTGGVAKTYNPTGFLTTDNSYLTVGVELGWPGLVLFLTFLAAMALTSFRTLTRVRDYRTRWLQAGLTAGLLISLVSFVLNAYINSSANGFFWFFMGLLAFMNVEAERWETPAAEARPEVSGPAPAPQPSA